MKFCQPHWDALRAAIEKRGLSNLIAKDGKAAVERMKEEVEGKASDDNYDPLMSSHWMIMNNAMEMIGKVGGNPLALMMSDPEHPELECPICYLNYLSKEHDRTCTVADCKKVKGQTFDDWIDLAADRALEYCREHNLITTSLPGARP